MSFTKLLVTVIVFGFLVFYISFLLIGTAGQEIDLIITKIEIPTIVTLITWLYMGANTGRLVAYLPQMWKALKCTDGAVSISIITWLYFTFSFGAGTLYSKYILKDFNTTLLFASNLIACLVLVSILIWKRTTYSTRVR
jgi:hypothetical protein